MSARILDIVHKFRASPVMLVSLQDFTWNEAGDIDPQLIIDQPQFSLYCLDDEGKQAIFVETPPEVDLSGAPFYYQAQFEHATRLIALPYETLHRLARQHPVRDERLILIYSVGRCGSTLLSRVFNLPDNLLSLSEPDVFTQIVALREQAGSRDMELTELLGSCVSLMCKPSPQKKPELWALKFRSFGINIGDLFHRLYPGARAIFLYRHAESWAQSAARAFISAESEGQAGIQQALDFLARFIPDLPLYMARSGEGLTATDLLTLVWLSPVQQYMALHEKGVAMCATRYEDLTATPGPLIERLFAYCHLPPPDPEALNRILVQDSQAGSILSQARTRQQASPLTEAHLAQLRDFLSREPLVNTPDFVVPGTLLNFQ